MKALITAGGRATRLRPITSTINKHLIPLAGKPMLVHAIEKVVAAGIREIGINVNPGEVEIRKVLGDGSAWGARITCIEQIGGPRGLAHIVKNARSFLGDEPFLFYLGDNIILGDLGRFVRKFEEERLDCLLALVKVADPTRFGVPVFDGGRLVRVEEKPAEPKSDFVVTGIYLYSPKVFDAVDAVQPSARGEYEISDVHTRLIESGANVGTEEITGWWKDTGTPDDLLEGNRLLLDELAKQGSSGGTHPEATVEPTARLDGPAWIGQGSFVQAGCLIRGPVVIGRDCRIVGGSVVGPYASLGDGVTVERASIADSIVMDRAQIKFHARRRDFRQSIIGREVQIGSLEAESPQEYQFIIGDRSQVVMYES